MFFFVLLCLRVYTFSDSEDSYSRNHSVAMVVFGTVCFGELEMGAPLSLNLS